MNTNSNLKWFATIIYFHSVECIQINMNAVSLLYFLVKKTQNKHLHRLVSTHISSYGCIDRQTLTLYNFFNCRIQYQSPLSPTYLPSNSIQDNGPGLHFTYRRICKIQHHGSVLSIQGGFLYHVTARISPIHRTVHKVKGQTIWC